MVKNKAEGNPTLAEIRWVKASDSIDWDELAEWTANIEAGGRIPLLIIDDEHSVVTYRSTFHQPNGICNPLSENSDVDQRRIIAHAWSESRETSEGIWLDIEPQDGQSMGLESVSKAAYGYQKSKGVVSRIVNPTMPIPSMKSAEGSNFFPIYFERIGDSLRFMVRVGVLMQVQSVGSCAPWLIVPVEEAPTNWGEVCYRLDSQPTSTNLGFVRIPMQATIGDIS